MIAIPGIGPFSAELILLRGAGDPDYTPTAEPRLARAMATAYGMKAPPSAADIAEISEVWKPYRTWVALLLRVMLEDETHEIGSRRIGSRAVLKEAAVESRTANRRDSPVPTLSLQRAPALS